MRARPALIFVAALVALGGCQRTTQVGSLLCSAASDCSPPSTVCGPDAQCIPGCGVTVVGCASGTSCDSTTGECIGPSPEPCSTDANCNPPDTICRPSTKSCVAGCTILDGCSLPQTCSPTTGRCCTLGTAGCLSLPTLDASVPCNSDSECPGAPATICSAGACVPGCGVPGSASCTGTAMCNSATGHCETPDCTRDVECDNGSYCNQGGQCLVLAYGGHTDCDGKLGTTIQYKCDSDTTVASFSSCIGSPGPAGCPYCLDDSCFVPALCTDDDDCHAENQCAMGLCELRAATAACASLVALADVESGKYAAGKEVCLSGKVQSEATGSDGLYQVRLGTSPYLYVKVSPLFATVAGVVVPKANQTVTVHGTVRWDESHQDWELSPVDFVSVLPSPSPSP